MSVAWEPGQDLRRFAQRLAACNGYTLAEIMGDDVVSVDGCQYVDRGLSERLSALTGEPVEVFAQEPRQYRPVVQRHALTGWVEPDGTNPNLWVERLPDTPDGRRIRDDVRTTSWPEVRLNLLTGLARALLPQLTASWPAHPSFELDDRAAVLADDTRRGRIEEWTPLVRRYALTALWDHTYLGTVASLRSRTPVARDLLTAHTWRHAATSAETVGLGSIGAAFRAAAAQWPPAENPRSPTGEGELPPHIRVRAGDGPLPGPFSVPALRSWPRDLVYAVHVADVAMESWRHHQDPATAWTRRALQGAAERLAEPVEPVAPLGLWGYHDREPPPYATEACRLLATDVGRRVLLEVAALATGGDSVPQDRVLRSWWPTLRRYPLTTLGDRSTLATVDPKLVAHLLWIDLTGHLPRTLSYGPPAFGHDLAEAAQKAAAEDILAMREWATQLMAGDDLPSTERRRTGAVGEANVR
ncbi:hypothetical protein [Flexivirga sp. B27]